MTTNKFKFKLKITGFELEVEGSKEDVAAITSTVSNQLKGLTSPPVISDNAVTEDIDSTEVSNGMLHTPSPKKKKTRKAKTPGSSSSPAIKVEAIDFRNDPNKYGNPSLQWSTVEKATWILYVVQNEKKISELTLTQISKTFNKHFRQSKEIRPSNISRDFGKAKQGATPLVQENATTNPSAWYLTTQGETYVQNLIKASKSNGTS